MQEKEGGMGRKGMQNAIKIPQQYEQFMACHFAVKA